MEAGDSGLSGLRVDSNAGSSDGAHHGPLTLGQVVDEAGGHVEPLGSGGLLLGFLVFAEGTEDGDLLSLAADRGSLGVGFEQMQRLAILFCKRMMDEMINKRYEYSRVR